MERQHLQERMLEDSVAVYKDCLGLERNVFVVCDSGFIRYLYLHIKTNDDQLAGLSTLFGVDSLTLKTTWCVIEDMKTEVKKAKKRHDEWLHEQFQDHKGEQWWDKEAQVLADDVEYKKNLKKFALSSMEAVCNHKSKPISSGACIFKLFETELSRPFIMGTRSRSRSQKIVKICGRPSVMIKLNKMTVAPRQIKRAHKETLETLKARRLEIAEEAEEELKGGIEAEEAEEELKGGIEAEEELKRGIEEEAEGGEELIGGVGGRGARRRRRRRGKAQQV